MGAVENIITDNLPIWSSAIQSKSSAGRGTNSKRKLYGVKKLRELILDLAVRGLLVPQDPNDEPASVLLKKIVAEKDRLIKSGKIKRSKPSEPIPPSEDLFDLPKNWAWERLKTFSILENGDRGKNYPNKSALVDSGVPFVNAGHLVNGQINDIEMTFITEGRYKILSGGKFRIDDILFCLRGSLGKVALVKSIERGAIASSLVIIRILSNIFSRYLLLVLSSSYTKQLIEEFNNGTAQPNLSSRDLSNFIIPIPPQAEQHRIVAKVDELMALCDTLEQQQEDSIQAHETLVEALLEALTDAIDADAFQAAWQRISEHFDVLFTTEHSIEKLKETILQLAVMGKLVPQDPNDEPASVLLASILAEKERFTQEGTLRKQKIPSKLHDQIVTPSPPAGWIETAFGEVMFNLDAQRVPLSVEMRRHRKGDYDYYGASGVIDQIDDYLFDKPSLLIGEDGANLVNRSTPIAFIARGKYWVNNHAHVLGALHEIMLQYVEIHINAISLIPFITGMAQPKMNQAKMNSIPILLPPLAEQHRIVAKVDELMALCDQLNESFQQAQQTQIHLTDAVVENAL